MTLRSVLFLLFSFFLGSPLAFSQKPVPLSEEQQKAFDYAFINGNREKIVENYDKALEYFVACYKMDPRNAALNYVMAECFFVQKRYVEADHFGRAAISLDNQNTWYKELMVDICLSQKRTKEAADLLVEIGSSRKHADYLMKASSLYGVVGDYKTALRTLNTLEKNIGFNEEIAVRREQIYLAQNKLPKAIQEIERLVRLNPREARYKGMLADLFWANGRAEDAAAIYHDILKENPHNGFAAFALADYYKLKNDHNQWYTYLKTGMASTDVEARNKIPLLTAFMEGRQFPDQQQRLLELSSLFMSAHPGNPLPFLVLGDVYKRQNQLDSARIHYRKALVIDPSSYIAWEQAIFCSSLLLNNDTLLRDCEDAISFFPSSPSFYAYGSIAAMQLKQYNKAIEMALSGLSNTTPDQEDLLFQFNATLADAYHYANKHSQSDSIYESLIRADSSNAYALNNYAYFLCLRKTKLDLAERLSRKSMLLDPNNASYLDTYGWIMFTMGKYDEAQKYIEKSLLIVPNNAEVVEHLGDVLFKLNNTQEAINTWQKAKKLGADSPLLNKKITDGKWYE